MRFSGFFAAIGGVLALGAVVVTDAAAAVALPGTVTPAVLASGRVRDINGGAFGPVVDATNFEIFANASGFITNSIFELDLSGLVAGDVTSITINYSGHPGTDSISIFGYEGNGTLEASDALNFTNLLTTDTMGPSGSITFSGSFIDAILMNGGSILGLNLTPNGATVSQGFFDMDVVFNVADPVPLPAAAPLFVAGIAGAGWLRRRRTA